VLAARTAASAAGEPESPARAAAIALRALLLALRALVLAPRETLLRSA
jgi:hypothetical protein